MIATRPLGGTLNTNNKTCCPQSVPVICYLVDFEFKLCPKQPFVQSVLKIDRTLFYASLSQAKAPLWKVNKPNRVNMDSNFILISVYFQVTVKRSHHGYWFK